MKKILLLIVFIVGLISPLIGQSMVSGELLLENLTNKDVKIKINCEEYSGFRPNTVTVSAFSIEAVNLTLPSGSFIELTSYNGLINGGSGIGCTHYLKQGFDWIVEHPNRTLEVVSTESSASIYIETNPAGAKLYIEGDYKGTTPLEITLPVNIHKLKFELDGYQGFVSYVVPGLEKSVSFTFSRENTYLKLEQDDYDQDNYPDLELLIDGSSVLFSRKERFSFPAGTRSLKVNEHKFSYNFIENNQYTITSRLKIPITESLIDDAATLDGYMPLTEKPKKLQEWKWEMQTVTRNPEIEEIILPTALAGGLCAILGAVAGSGEGKIGPIPGALVLSVPVMIFGGAAMMNTSMEFEDSVKVDDIEKINKNRKALEEWKTENKEAMENNDRLIEVANAEVNETNLTLEQKNKNRGYLEIFNNTTGETCSVYPSE